MKYPLIALLALASLVGGCSLSRKYPERAAYALMVTPTTQAARPATAPVWDKPLRVQRVRVANPSCNQPFVYRMAENRFTTDYYNGFFTEPADMITGALRYWLNNSGIFPRVLPASSPADAQYILDTDVYYLYGDYTDPKKPAAVFGARFFLIDMNRNEGQVLVDKNVRIVEPMESATPEQLVKAWERAIQRAFDDLGNELRSTAPSAR